MKPNESTLANTKEGIIEEFIQADNSLKKQQIEVLIQNYFELLAQEYKTDPIIEKRKNKQNTKYVVPLISATRSFTEALQR